MLYDVLFSQCPAGVNPAAAKSLLGAATSVGDSFSSDTSSSSIAQGARSAQLRVLAPRPNRRSVTKGFALFECILPVSGSKFSKLGSALLQQVPAGSTSTVSTVEGGKGTASWLHYADFVAFVP